MVHTARSEESEALEPVREKTFHGSLLLEFFELKEKLRLFVVPRPNEELVKSLDAEVILKRHNENRKKIAIIFGLDIRFIVRVV